MSTRAITLVLLLLASTLAPSAVASTQSQAGAYAGTHVSFDTETNAIVDYSVGGTTMLGAVAVQSTSESQSRGIIQAGADLSAVTSVAGSAVSVESSTEARATLSTESGAEIAAHDNGRGVLVVRPGSESQYVTANVSGTPSAEDENRVVVTSEDGTEGTFVVVGDGEVTVNEEGNVAARLESEGTLVFRSYPNGRSDADVEQEQLIADGTAAAEVYVMETSEGSSEFAADVVSYSEDTTVEVTERSRGTLEMTADRSSQHGKVILCTISEAAMNAAQGLQVTVDGEAAVEASSYGELKSAANGGESSMFLVEQAASAQASADVLVAVDHFSERQVTVSEGGDSGSDGGSGSDGSSSPGQPGFGVLAALLALLATAGLVRWRGA